jgi:hypothetical protein
MCGACAGDQVVAGAEFFIADPNPAVSDETLLDLVVVVSRHLTALGHVQ